MRQHQGQHKQSSCATFMLNSHWGRADTGKKKSLVSVHTRSLWLCLALCDPVDCGLTGLSVKEVLHARIWSLLANTGCDTFLSFSSVAQSCLTLCDLMNRSTPGLPVHHHLPEFTKTHFHRVRDAIQPSHPRSSPSPPAPNPSQHQSLFQ